MAGLLDIGKSALQSYRQALSVTGQNIANINTEGYKRREASLAEISGSQGGVTSLTNQLGLGVRVDEIRRSFDEFLLNKARSSASYAESQNSFVDNLAQLEDILLPGESNLGAMIGRFFSGLQEVAASPSDLAPRVVAMEAGQSMVNSFRQLASMASQQQQDIEEQVSQSIDEINLLSAELAKLNARISSSGSTVLNSLLDTRDNLIDQISRLAEVSVSLSGKGGANLTLGNSGKGPKLVTGDVASQLAFALSDDNLNWSVISVDGRRPTSQITNGVLKGLQAGWQTIAETKREVDNLAFLMVRDLNAAHLGGLDMEGNPAVEMFQALDVTAQTDNANRGEVSAEVSILDFTQVKSEPVIMRWHQDDQQWIARNEAGKTLTRAREQLFLSGLSVTISGNPQDGDELRIDPALGTASGMSFMLSRPQQIAAADPVLASADASNFGTADISIARVAPPVKVDTLAPVNKILVNGASSIAATEFRSDGPIMFIPSNAEAVELFSLSSQASAQFTVTEDDASQASALSFAKDGISYTFSLNYGTAFPLAEGSWTDAGEIAKMLNLGVITASGNGRNDVTLAELGGYAAGGQNLLSLALAEGEFTTDPSVSLSDGNLLTSAVSSPNPTASEMQIFTREGRHLAGGELTDAEIAELITEENGFHAEASYRDEWLNGSGEDGYRGLTLARRATATETLLTITDREDGQLIEFDRLAGIDGDAASIDGGAVSAAQLSYRVQIGNKLNATISASDVEGESDAAIAAAMAAKLRSVAPIAHMTGAASVASLPEEASYVMLNYEDQSYRIDMLEGELVVSGGEPGRLIAWYDSDQIMHVQSNSGSLVSSVITVAEGQQNLDRAETFGLVAGETQPASRLTYNHVEIDKPLSDNHQIQKVAGFAASDLAAMSGSLVSLALDGKTLDVAIGHRPIDMNITASYEVRSIEGFTADDLAGLAGATLQFNMGDQSLQVSFLEAPASTTELASLIKQAAGFADLGITLKGGFNSLTADVPDGLGELNVKLYLNQQVTEKDVVVSRDIRLVSALNHLDLATLASSELQISDGTDAITLSFETAPATISQLADYIQSAAGYETLGFRVTSLDDQIAFDYPANDPAIAASSVTVTDTYTPADTQELADLITAAPTFAELGINLSGGTNSLVADVFDGMGPLTLSVSKDSATVNKVVTVQNEVKKLAGLGGDDLDSLATNILRLSDGTTSVEVSFGSAPASLADLVSMIEAHPDYASLGFRVMEQDDLLMLRYPANSTLDTDTVVTLVDTFEAQDFNIQLDSDRIVVTRLGQSDPQISATASSLAGERVRFSNLPDEELIVVLTGNGARKVTSNYDILPENAPTLVGDITVRVTDAERGEVEFIETATGTSIATRRLDEKGQAAALAYQVRLQGSLANDDSFHIQNNENGMADGRNLDRLLELQIVDPETGAGGFQKQFSQLVAGVGAQIQTGRLSAEAANALSDAAKEAEASFAGVNLDNEAARLIEQQQAYQASARILSTARELFNTLLDSV